MNEETVNIEPEVIDTIDEPNIDMSINPEIAAIINEEEEPGNYGSIEFTDKQGNTTYSTREP